MTEEKSTAGQGLGIAGMILGGIAAVICWIPCLGMFALIPGIVGIILSAIGLAQANKNNGAKGLVIAALIVSIIATAIAGWQYYALSAAASEATGIENWAEDFSKEMDDLNDDLDAFDQDMQGVADGFENTGEDIGNALTGGEDVDIDNIDFTQKLSDEQFDNIMDKYEGTLEDYKKFVEKAENGDLSALGSYIKVATKLTLIASKLAIASPNLTEEQIERVEEMNNRFEEVKK